MKRVFSILLALICLLAMAAPAMAAASYEDIGKSVVRVYVEAVHIFSSPYTGEVVDQIPEAWTGTAFAVGKPGEPVKYFVTNNHVAPEVWETEDVWANLEDAEGNVVSTKLVKETVPQVYLVFTNFQTKVPVNVVATSDRCDLAILGLNEPTTDREAAVIRSFKGIDELGHVPVYAAGFPGVSDRLNQNTLLEDTMNSYLADMTFTEGMVNTLKEDAVTLEGEQIQHTAKVTGGNSGGPLVDKNGHVIGVNTTIYTDAANVGYCMSITSNEVIRFLDQEKIEYTTADAFKKGETMKYVLIAAGAVVVIAIVVAIILVKNAGSKKNSRSLYCDAGSLLGRKYPLKKGKISIGHDSSRCQIVFPTNSPGVSGLHCSVVFDGKEVKVTDENSRYGTWIDNNRLQPGVPTTMHRGQKLYLGSNKQALSLHN